MADRWRCMLVAGIAAVVLAVPAGAVAKAPAKRACQSAAKAKKPRCRASANRAARARPASRGLEQGHVAPAAILDDGPASSAGRVLEI
jgi:hypothetical protein